MKRSVRWLLIAAGMSMHAGVATAASPKLAWDPNTEATLAGYKLYFGTQSRTCFNDPQLETFTYGGAPAAQGGSPIVIFLDELRDRNSPDYILVNVPDSVRYFSVTAFDSSGRESRYSGEVSLANSPQGPVLCDASANLSSAVVVTFSEYVDMASATDTANYTLRNTANSTNVAISSIDFDPGFKKVTLNTAAALATGIPYELTVNNVKDYFDPALVQPNSQKTFTYTTAPTLRTAGPLNNAPPHLELVFNKDIDASSSSLASNFSISNGLSVIESIKAINRNFSEDERGVHLTTSSPLTEGQSYTVTVNNVADTFGNIIAPNSTIQFQMPVDTTAPHATAAHVVNPLARRNEVHVAFDEEVDQATATNIVNYSISNGVAVGAATLLGDRRTVVLSTAAHADGAYQINISGVRDNSAAGNLMLPTVLNYRVVDIVADADGDARENVRDNCTLVANTTAPTSQRDTDSDKIGNACDGDLNNDGIVNVLDLGLFRAAFGKNTNPNADFNGDDIVNVLDLGLFRQMFGKAPGPSGTVP